MSDGPVSDGSVRRGPAGRGRRPGTPDTREEILTSARTLFADRGFRRTTIRAVAADAEVDPALVHHYFGTKDDLFLAALKLPVDPRQLIAPALAGGPDGAAERLLRVFLSVWDDPSHQLAMLGLFRSMVEPSGERLLRDGFVPVVLVPVAERLGLDRPEVRMPLVASQLLGLILVRYVLALEPVASMGADDVVAVFAPTVQRYLTGGLPALDDPGSRGA